jgi:hypothetical protein
VHRTPPVKQEARVSPTTIVVRRGGNDELKVFEGPSQEARGEEAMLCDEGGWHATQARNIQLARASCDGQDLELRQIWQEIDLARVAIGPFLLSNVPSDLPCAGSGKPAHSLSQP